MPSARTLVAAVVATAALAVPATTATAADARAEDGGAARSWTPTARAMFGHPGSNGVKRGVLAAIDNTPAGATIRGASWSFSDYDYAYALNRARLRGVHVRLIVGANSRNYSAAAWLKDRLGSNMHFSAGAARRASRLSDAGTMHQKVWLFSRTGGKPYVTIVASANATDEATDHQFVDGWQFVDYQAIYDRFVGLYGEMWQHVTLDAPFRQINLSPNTAMTISPWNYQTMPDPVVARIDGLPTNGLVIRAANAAWYGTRGVAIARALARKKAAGANISVIYGKPIGAKVLEVLRNAGISRRNAYYSTSCYLHDKFMTASWVSSGVRKYRVWEGSENWGDNSVAADEAVVKIGNPAAYSAYSNWFSQITSANC